MTTEFSFHFWVTGFFCMKQDTGSHDIVFEGWSIPLGNMHFTM